MASRAGELKKAGVGTILGVSYKDRSGRERAMLGVIDSAVRRGAETGGNIRNYLLGRRKKRSRIDVGQLLYEVLQLARPMLETHANIRLRRDLELCGEVYGNPDELRRAFLNLLLNAIDAMPKGGTFTVKCVPEGGRVVVSMRAPAPESQWPIRTKSSRPTSLPRPKVRD